MNNQLNPRLIATRCLLRVIYYRESLTDVLQNSAKNASLSHLLAKNQSLVRDICYGCLRWHLSLNAILNQLLAKPLKKKDKDIECLLFVGLYQIIYQRIPDHAAVNETVKASKGLKKNWSRGLINGVLRTFQRKKTHILKQLKHSEVAYYAFPDWLIQQIKQAYPQHWQQILQNSNQHAPMSLRVNLQQQTRKVYVQKLLEIGLESESLHAVPSAISLKKPVDVNKLPGFHAGEISVQDMAAQWASYFLDCKAHHRVLDACAAPGGKTAHLLETYPSINLTAIDKDSKRLLRLHDNLARLRLIANIKTANATQPDTWWDGKLFDRILLDAPCSATGIIRRHPDIKLLKQKTDIKSFQAQQWLLLTTLWKLLRPKGKILYSTCSILPKENTQQITHFLTKHPDATIVNINENPNKTAIGWQILPNDKGMDGFYYAILQKKD